jgi:uncharacterized protein
LSRVFVDTSAWLALLDRNSRHHRAVAAEAKARERRLVTSNFVLDETLTLARHRLGWNVARSFGERLRAGQLALLLPVEPADEDAAWAIFVRYHDHDFSFTDCTSFALMRRLRLDTALSLDADFRTFGLHCLP